MLAVAPVAPLSLLRSLRFFRLMSSPSETNSRSSKAGKSNFSKVEPAIVATTRPRSQRPCTTAMPVPAKRKASRQKSRGRKKKGGLRRASEAATLQKPLYSGLPSRGILLIKPETEGAKALCRPVLSATISCRGRGHLELEASITQAAIAA